jgi:thioredoxin reductase (NADPH)
VDDDGAVARAVARDLRRHLGERYRIVSAESGQAALEVLDELVLRGEPLAMVLADQRMPGMTGVELLERTRRRAPSAKRVLLTAYADTDAAIRAINEVRLDHYLLKPWDPPEENLYPVVDDLLGDWAASEPAAEEVVRVVGHRWSAASHRMRDFLTRNGLPYRWLDVERHAEARQIVDAAGLDPSSLPVVVFPDGTALGAPEHREVAERAGLSTRAGGRFYDLVIVGGGPSGLAAAVYGASEGLSTVLVEREAPGGQAGQSSRIENYLGFPVGLSGADLTRRATAQAQRFGAELLTAQEVTSIEADGPARAVVLADGSELRAHALLIATGVAYRRLGVPGADRLTGRGLYYGAARTEALACEGEHVFVVGAANSAGQAAMYFSTFAGRVSILCRGEGLHLSMSRYLIDQIEATPNIEVRAHTHIAEVHGDDHVDALTLRGPGGDDRVDAGSVFVFIGASPRTDWLADAVARDDRGFVLAGPDVAGLDGRLRWPLERDPLLLETSMPGVFVAGDVRHQSVKRVASAVGEGSMAVQFVHQYLGELP